MRVATYTRISTDEEHQPFSLESQAERLDAYVRSQDGWEVVRRFVLTCSLCGSKFIGTAARGNKYRYRYYTCHRRNRYGIKGCPSERLPAEELDQAVLKAMLEAYSNSDLVEQALEEARRRMPAAATQLKGQLAAVEADICKAEEALERYFLAFEAGTMNQDVCAPRIEALGRRLTAKSIAKTADEIQGLVTFQARRASQALDMAGAGVVVEVRVAS